MLKLIPGSPKKKQIQCCLFATRNSPGNVCTDFKQILETSLRNVPFGVAQIGKAFRNEITPGNFIFRTREFEQMEIEYFIPPMIGKNTLTCGLNR
jgi:hypothetical protein